MTDTAAPTDHELDMALTWTCLNALRMFHRTPPDDITEAEERFLKAWRVIPAERRQAALDSEIAVPSVEEIQRRRAVKAMRERVL